MLTFDIARKGDDTHEVIEKVNLASIAATARRLGRFGRRQVSAVGHEAVGRLGVGAGVGITLRGLARNDAVTTLAGAAIGARGIRRLRIARHLRNQHRRLRGARGYSSGQDALDRGSTSSANWVSGYYRAGANGGRVWVPGYYR